MKCTAKTSTGTPCKSWAIQGGRVCRTHGGSAPQVKAKARARLEALVNPAITQLDKRVKDDENPGLALAAAKDILDRAGFGAPAPGQTSMGTVFQVIMMRAGDPEPVSSPVSNGRVLEVVLDKA
jgi:hypothetical protein